MPTGTVLSNHALVAAHRRCLRRRSATTRTVLRAHYGRYYDALFGGQFEFMDLSQQHPKITAEVLGPNNFNEIDRRDPVDEPRDRSEHQAVVRRPVPRRASSASCSPNFSLTAQYIRRNFRDFMGFVDTGSIYAPTQKRRSRVRTASRNRRRRQRC